MSPASHRLRVGRYSHEGHAYLLTTVCHVRRKLLTQEAACVVLESARWLDRAGRCELIAITVMPDHVHLAARLTTVPLAALMHGFKSHTSHAINRLRGQSGRIWQNGYHDAGIRDDVDLQTCVDYCVQNPIRAGLVEDIHQYPHWWCRWEI